MPGPCKGCVRPSAPGFRHFPRNHSHQVLLMREMTAASIAGLLPTLVMPVPEWPDPPSAPVSSDTADLSCDEENVRLNDVEVAR